MKTSYCFKLVQSLGNGKYKSRYNVYPVVYEIGKITRAPEGGLLVFDTFENVQMFCSSGTVLFGKGSYRIALPKFRLSVWGGPQSRGALKSLWYGGFESTEEGWPEGTLAYEEFLSLAVVRE